MKRILLVDSQPVVRERLTELINAESDLCVCGAADNAVAVAGSIMTTEPDLVVLGLALPDCHGLELLKDIHRQHGSLPVLVFSFYSENLYAERAIRAGARGYLSKNRPTSEVIAAVRRVLEGELYLSPLMLARIAGQHLSMKRNLNGEAPRISDRELQVFELIGTGHGSSTIAARLGVTVKTIESYCDRLKNKLCVPNAAELRQAAIRAVHSGKLHGILAFVLPWLSLLTDTDVDLNFI